jgi:hypothetical protein
MNRSIIFLTAAILTLAATAPAADSPLKAIEQPEGCLITENGKNVLFYQRTTKSLEGRYPRSNYVHPLYDLDGQVISEDFPKDHLHHRGIFWAWHQLLIGDKKVGDAWECKNFSSDVTALRISQPTPKSVRLTISAAWKSPLWLDPAGKEKPFVQETTTIVVHAATAGTRAIDFHIRLAALEDGLRIGGSDDDKGYSGFSPRIRFPRNLRFAGPNGTVEPKNSAVDAGPWIDFSGKFGEGDDISGVAMLSHPSLPEFPSKWILRSKTSMQNAAYPGRVPVLIPREKPLDLRYRLIIHKGDEKQANLAQLQAEYEKVK